MENRAGVSESAQISIMGAISISSSDFIKDVPFCIKNDGSDAVTLEVNLWSMPEGEFVSTVFECGWNPEIVRTVKKKTGSFNLKWGY